MSRSILILLLIIPLAAFLLERAGLLFPARAIAGEVLTPVTGALSQVFLEGRDFVRALFVLPDILKENNALLTENRQLKAELADKFDVFHENDLLRAELNLPSVTRDRPGLAAFIVGRSRTGPFGTFIINRGAKDGLQRGQIALSQGILAGRLSDVAETTSILVPITNVNSTIPVTLVESRGIGLLKGGVRGLVVEEIARDVPLVEGEAVVTSDLGGIVPAGLLVGNVEGIVREGADVFQSVIVSSPIPFNWLELVVILP